MSKAVVLIESKGPVLEHESGVHTVQRESGMGRKRRMHTSTTAVALLQMDEVCAVNVQDKDIRVEVFRGHGNGGQARNKIDSAVRMTHIPTGVVAQSQETPSQHVNRQLARAVLEARVRDLHRKAQEQKQTSERSTQLGGRTWSEKRRTYNFVQNRITDHILSITVNDLERTMRTGRLDVFYGGR